jgi:hypothetical protein
MFAIATESTQPTGGRRKTTAQGEAIAASWDGRFHTGRPSRKMRMVVEVSTVEASV